MLTKYGHVVRVKREISYQEWDGLSTEAKNDILWPQNLDILLEQIRMWVPQTDNLGKMILTLTHHLSYIGYVAKRTSPRSNRGNGQVTYGFLCNERAALLFWINRLRPEFPKHVVYNQITEVMRYCVKKLKLSIRGTGTLSEIGLEELRQLIDFDMTTSLHMEAAEVHHLAWCIGRMCAVRPGSLGWSGTKEIAFKNAPSHGPPYLVWKDVEITKVAGGDKAMFQVQLTIRNLKTNFTDPEKAMTKSKLRSSLVFNILPPKKSSNLTFSIPHRLLAIGIRRGIFRDISSIDDLFALERHAVNVKEAHLMDPILLAGKPKGGGVADSALSSRALSSYLTDRGRKVGYGERVTFYSILRRSATNLAKKIGLSATRILMNHEGDDQILEGYYLNILPTIDVTSHGLDDDDDDAPDGGRSAVGIVNSTLAMNALTEENTKIVHGPALNALMAKMMNTDPNFPTFGSAAEFKNY